MALIDVDFEVFKALTARRDTEGMTENDVIRGLLELPGPADRSKVDAPGLSWTVKGVSFPPGTEFRVTYKGRLVYPVWQKTGLWR